MTELPTLVLHIGHFKTGTTALQVFMGRNERALAAQGIFLAHTARQDFRHGAIPFEMLAEAGQPRIAKPLPGTPSAQQLWRDLLDEARALPPGATLIASSEEFMRLATEPAACAALARMAAQAAGVRVRVIAYLRAPGDHVRSWYNQLIKVGIQVPGFDATVVSQLEPFHLEYDVALQPWIEAFGADAVLVRTYRPDLRHGDAMYRDFFGALGLPMLAQSAIPDYDANPRFDDRMLPYVRVLNQRGIPGDQRDRLHARGLTALAERDEMLSPAEIAQRFKAINQRAAQAIARVAALPGADLDVEALLSTPITPDTPLERSTADAITLLLSEMLVLRTDLRELARRVDALERPAPDDQSSA